MTAMQGFQAWQGLSEQEASARLARFGANLIHEPKSRSLREILHETLREPMFLLLIGAATLYLFIGDLAEGLFLTGGALLSLTLVILQRSRTEHALRTLNALAEPRARVVRDGKVRTIPARELVPGDLVLVAEGGRVQADSVLVRGDALEVDESALTGESNPCLKTPFSGSAADYEIPAPGEEVSSALYAATLVVRGQGVAEVRRTGSITEVGRIGSELGTLREEPTLLQRDTGRLIRRLGVLAVAFCLIVILVYGIVRRDWFNGALSGITLAISLIPEEFPMVLTIFMALGAWRLARHNVLVRRSAVIETLGATTLLCVDKTGTLTENRMALREGWREGRLIDLAADRSDEAARLIASAQLASMPEAHDPMDAAIHQAAGAPSVGTLLRSYPLRPGFLAFVQVWRLDDGAIVYAAKGAHETILSLCELDEPQSRITEKAAHEMGARGRRVLAVATTRFDSDPGLAAEQLKYRFEGLIAFEDPVRADVPGALAEARQAGVSVAMITGDFPATAMAAAKAVGISTSAGVISGAELADSSEVPPDARIFARITPEQKLRLVQHFRNSGQVVAMTGDGINDAPALAAADIGIAMGQRGTDVAREASDLILLDDRFASIVGGVRLGRRIFANLRRAMTYITAVHVPVAGLALLPILLGLPPLLYPMHLVLLELLIDPLCSIVFETEPSEPDSMRKPPRPRYEPLFGWSQISFAILQGLVLLATVLSFYVLLVSRGEAEGAARAAAFTSLFVGHLALAVAAIASNTTKLIMRERIPFLLIITGAVLLLALALIAPFMRELLRFSTISTELLAVSVGLGMIAGGWSLRAGNRQRRPGPH
jgi:Ca2+-transporting ATPase